ncbi:hypothetical protein [Brevibacterium otitidis]|uniref:Uncharacterized protein n=1 Tax=Brevibacterium otitidis TaxID=53364 RepID=A0ABV5X1L7_9MICO|nr:hypothetical protein GCM10023233_14560 [Brevibacterium otitidis]
MWGTYPEWISAITAIGALIFAATAWLAAKRMLQLEQERDAKAFGRERERQARCIAAWVVGVRWIPKEKERVMERDRKHRDDKDSEPSSIGVMIANSSDAPVYDVRVEFGNPENSTVRAVRADVRTLPPGQWIKVLRENARWRIASSAADELEELDQQRSWVFLQGERSFESTIPLADARKYAVVGIEFTDSRENRWRRDVRGRLTLTEPRQ